VTKDDVRTMYYDYLDMQSMVHALMECMLKANYMIANNVAIPLVLVVKSSFDSLFCRLVGLLCSVRSLSCI
jgi:hypothetical protein